MRNVWTLAIALALATGAMAQDKRGLTLGPEVGGYFPADGKMRDLMGSTWLHFGIGPTRAEVAEGWAFSADLKFLSRRNKGNKLFIALPAFGVSKSFGYLDDRWVPYVALRGGPSYVDYSITDAGRRSAAKRFGVSAKVEVGLVVDGRLRIHAGYHWISKQDRFDFSGVSVGATFELIRW